MGNVSGKRDNERLKECSQGLRPIHLPMSASCRWAGCQLRHQHFLFATTGPAAGLSKYLHSCISEPIPAQGQRSNKHTSCSYCWPCSSNNTLNEHPKPHASGHAMDPHSCPHRASKPQFVVPTGASSINTPVSTGQGTDSNCIVLLHMLDCCRTLRQLLQAVRYSIWCRRTRSCLAAHMLKLGPSAQHKQQQ